MSTKDEAARYVSGVANKKIAGLEARIKKMANLAHCAYAYVNNPQEIETWLDEIIRVANEAAQPSVQRTGGYVPPDLHISKHGKALHDKHVRHTRR